MKAENFLFKYPLVSEKLIVVSNILSKYCLLLTGDLQKLTFVFSFLLTKFSKIDSKLIQKSSTSCKIFVIK